jgi:hypothetical protein
MRWIKVKGKTRNEKWQARPGCPAAPEQAQAKQERIPWSWKSSVLGTERVGMSADVWRRSTTTTKRGRQATGKKRREWTRAREGESLNVPKKPQTEGKAKSGSLRGGSGVILTREVD